MGERTGRENLPSQMLRFRLLATVMLLSALVAASCASRTAPAGHPGGTASTGPAARPTPTATITTTVKTYTPFAAAGHLRIATGHVARGSCFAASAADPIAHAYRCLAGNELLDPCFADPAVSAPSTVACVADPWSAATVVTLTAKLPTAKPFGDGTRPWALQLDSGLRCTASTGTVPFVDSVALSFRCTGGVYAAVVDPKAATVTVQYGAATATVLKQARVSVMWRG